MTCISERTTTNLWPDSRVVACEPDPENLSLLHTNLLGYQNVEIVEAAILAHDLAEAEFHAVVNKAGDNSGGGSCVRVEPGSKSIRVPALAMIKLWESKGISSCDLLKLDCEGAELQILRALADAGLLRRVARIVGEWHACDGRADTPERVRRALKEILETTHSLVFSQPFRGKEGHFSAEVRGN